MKESSMNYNHKIKVLSLELEPNSEKENTQQLADCLFRSSFSHSLIYERFHSIQCHQPLCILKMKLKTENINRTGEWRILVVLLVVLSKYRTFYVRMFVGWEKKLYLCAKVVDVGKWLGRVMVRISINICGGEEI